MNFLNRRSVHDLYRSKRETIKDLLVAMKDSEILEADTQQLADTLFSKHALPTPSLDDSQEISKEYRTSVETVPSERRERFYRGEGDIQCEFEYLTLKFPVRNHRTLQTCRSLSTSTSSLSWSPMSFTIGDGYIQDEICVKGYGINPSEDQVVTDYNQVKSRVSDWIKWLEKDLTKENKDLKSWLNSIIDQRKDFVSKRQNRKDDLLSKLS